MRTVRSLALAVGLYRPARLLQRSLRPKEKAAFRAGLKFYGQFISPGELCFDIGANIGAKAELFMTLGARVIAVEPQPDLIREIKARTKHECVTVQSAVGESATLHLSKWDVHASLLNGWNAQETANIEVPVTTLDKLIKVHDCPRLVKIDVEGLEPAVLRGLSRPIDTIILEYHSDPAGVSRTKQCLELLASLGAYKLNATSEEKYDFTFPEWYSPGELANLLPINATYGDLIARI